MADSPSIPSDMIEENENLRQQVRELKDENEKLQKNTELLLKEYGFSKNKKKRELQIQNEKLCSENSELSSRVASLHRENQTLTQKVQAKEIAYEQNTQELKSALEQLKISEDSRKELQELHHQLNENVECMLNGVKQEKDKMRQKIQAQSATLENFKGFKELYKELKQENESLNNQNKDLKQQIEAVQEGVNEIKSVLRGLKSFDDDNNRIKQQNNALEQEVQELTKKLADCQKEVRQNEEALQEEMQELDKDEPHQSSFELTPESNESTEKEERIKTSKTTDLVEKNKDIPTESSSHMETPQEQTIQPRDVEEKAHGRWTRWLIGAALYLAFPDYIYPRF